MRWHLVLAESDRVRVAVRTRIERRVRAARRHAVQARRRRVDDGLVSDLDHAVRIRVWIAHHGLARVNDRVRLLCKLVVPPAVQLCAGRKVGPAAGARDGRPGALGRITRRISRDPARLGELKPALLSLRRHDDHVSWRYSDDMSPATRPNWRSCPSRTWMAWCLCTPL